MAMSGDTTGNVHGDDRKTSGDGFFINTIIIYFANVLLAITVVLGILRGVLRREGFLYFMSHNYYSWFYVFCWIVVITLSLSGSMKRNRLIKVLVIGGLLTATCINIAAIGKTHNEDYAKHTEFYNSIKSIKARIGNKDSICLGGIYNVNDGSNNLMRLILLYDYHCKADTQHPFYLYDERRIDKLWMMELKDERDSNIAAGELFDRDDIVAGSDNNFHPAATGKLLLTRNSRSLCKYSYDVFNRKKDNYAIVYYYFDSGNNIVCDVHNDKSVSCRNIANFKKTTGITFELPVRLSSPYEVSAIFIDKTILMKLGPYILSYTLQDSFNDRTGRFGMISYSRDGSTEFGNTRMRQACTKGAYDDYFIKNAVNTGDKTMR
jgi:hypothetical protein